MKRLSVISLIFSLLFILSCEDKVEKDTTPPLLTIVFPTSGSTVGEVVKIKVETSDDSGILKVDFYVPNTNVVSDTTSPYEYDWNTTSNEDGEYKIKVMSYDTKENFVESEVSVTIDNNSKKPSPLDIVSVDYTIEKMTVKWNQSQDSDFKQYNLHYSESENGNKKLVKTILDITTTSFDTTSFDPTKENWYFLEVLDNFGLSNIGKGKTNQIELPPTTSEIDSVIYSYEKESFQIFWEGNLDTDFKHYYLFESDNNDMSNQTEIVKIDNQETIFYEQLSKPGTEKYYQVVVEDNWGLKTKSEVKQGKSFIIFSKTFGGEDYGDYGYSVQQTLDGGYIMTGGTDSYGNDTQMFILKTDIYGTEEWRKIYGGNDRETGEQIQQTTDGGYIIVGSLRNGDEYDILVLKIDSQGNETWSKTFGGEKVDIGRSIQQTIDGGFIIVGSTESYSKGSTDVWLIKTDSEGNETWSKTFGGEKSDDGYSVQERKNGGYIITGGTKSFSQDGSYDVWLIRTDPEGEQHWTQIFGGDGFQRGNSVQETLDEGFIIIGITERFNEDYYLIKTNVNGNEMWSKSYGQTDYDKGRSGQQTNDGGFILTGTWTDNKCRIYKVDSQGNEIWWKTFSSSGGHSIQQTLDGGYIITGYKRNLNTNINDLWLLKTDSEGNTR